MTDSHNFIFLIGSQHAGTRILANIFYGSGYFLGERIYNAGEPLHHEPLVKLVKATLPFVHDAGNHRWNIEHLFEDTPKIAKVLMRKQIELLEIENQDLICIKYPDAIFALPWLVELCPNAQFIHVHRHPTTCLNGTYLNMEQFGGTRFDFMDNYRKHDIYHHASIICYQHQLVRRTLTAYPSIKYLPIQIEDGLDDSDVIAEKIEEFTGRTMIRNVKIDKARFFKSIEDLVDYPFLSEYTEDIYGNSDDQYHQS